MSESSMPKPRLYQLREKPEGFSLISMSDLKDAKVSSVILAEPDDPQLPYGEWYCTNERCVVREVKVYCKLHGERMPKLTCPACVQLLKFHHWLGQEMLLLVKDDA